MKDTGPNQGLVLFSTKMVLCSTIFPFTFMKTMQSKIDGAAFLKALKKYIRPYGCAVRPVPHNV